MKRLSLFHRPYFAKTVLEVGGGHAPFEGVTHAVDKYPDDNAQRAHNLSVPTGAEFREGDLEKIPFDVKFDFFYASHVLEHVENPQKAIDEVNRVARRGYIETPSPLREQVACPAPFDPKTDFHLQYCWTGKEPNTISVAKKSEKTLGDFCNCKDGQAAKMLFYLLRKHGYDVDQMLPRDAKATKLYFNGPIRLRTYGTLHEACAAGDCAYRSMRHTRLWMAFPFRLFSNRFGKLRDLMSKHRGEAQLL